MSDKNLNNSLPVELRMVNGRYMLFCIESGRLIGGQSSVKISCDIENTSIDVSFCAMSLQKFKDDKK